MGPFKNYSDGDNYSRYHNSWYNDQANFITSSTPWFFRGGGYSNGLLAGQFYFVMSTGDASGMYGFRIVLT